VVNSEGPSSNALGGHFSDHRATNTCAHWNDSALARLRQLGPSPGKLAHTRELG